MSNPIDLRTPCGVYYTYETNRATGRERMVINHAYNDIPAVKVKTFIEVYDDLINRDTCDGFYDWQPKIARVKEHMAKIAKGDTND